MDRVELQGHGTRLPWRPWDSTTMQHFREWIDMNRGVEGNVFGSSLSNLVSSQVGAMYVLEEHT